MDALVQKCQYYYTLLNQSIPQVTLRSNVSLQTEQSIYLYMTNLSFGSVETILWFFYFQITRLATARGRAYSEGRIGIKGYEFMYLIKGIGKPPVSQAQSAMLVLALKYGYQMPMALLEVSDTNQGEW